jgi:phosphohistidine phosphatase SixA
MEIILIRHAQRERAPSLGDDKDLPLSSEGRKQTEKLALKLHAPDVGQRSTWLVATRTP